MKLALLYTSHRQFAELDYLPRFFESLPRLGSSVDIIYHCNNASLAPGDLAEKLTRIPCRNLDLVYSPQRNEGGYPYGQFEAISDVWARLAAYDWVIHLHPDVFVVDEVPLLEAIDDAQAAGADILVASTFGLKHPSFATDFFAFRPNRVPQSLFDSHRSLRNTPLVVPLENLFFIEIHRAGLNYHVADRYRHGHYHRDIDRLGLWHEHNLKRVELYFKQDWRRWPPTLAQCLLRPYMSTRFILNWWSRRLKGVSQESLFKQLTAL